MAYPHIPSAIRPIQHSEEIPVPIFKGLFLSEDGQTMSDTYTEEVKSDLEDFSSNDKQFSLP